MSKPIIRRWDATCRYVKIGHVIVDQSKSLDTFQPTPAQVNWSAIGSVLPEEARLFLADLKLAIDLCAVLDESTPETWKLATYTTGDVHLSGWTIYLPPRGK